jgi:hypothetical protein
MEMRELVFLLLFLLGATTSYAQSDDFDPMGAAESFGKGFVDENTKKASEIENTVEVFTSDNVAVAEVDMYKNIDDSRPYAGIVSKAYMGDNMVVSRAGHYADCFEPDFSISENLMGG